MELHKKYANSVHSFLFHYNFLLYRWFELRRGAEEFLGLPVVPNPCPKGGENAYIPMKLSDAKLPNDDVRCV